MAAHYAPIKAKRRRACQAGHPVLGPSGRLLRLVVCGRPATAHRFDPDRPAGRSGCDLCPECCERAKARDEEDERMKTASLNELLKLARRNPTVRAAVETWHRGDLTFEQAMVFLVTTLAEQNERLAAAALRRLRAAPFCADPVAVEAPAESAGAGK